MHEQQKLMQKALDAFNLEATVNINTDREPYTFLEVDSASIQKAEDGWYLYMEIPVMNNTCGDVIEKGPVRSFHTLCHEVIGRLVTHKLDKVLRTGT